MKRRSATLSQVSLITLAHERDTNLNDIVYFLFLEKIQDHAHVNGPNGEIRFQEFFSREPYTGKRIEGDRGDALLFRRISYSDSFSCG